MASDDRSPRDAATPPVPPPTLTTLYAVRKVSNVWIALADGCRVAAKLWLPGTDKPCPAIFEWLPYRKTDHTAPRDERHHTWMCARGFAIVRGDLRGAGDSDGLLDDEYTEAELRDACEVIAWIAVRPWSNGSVGMYGKSWGGFNGLQVAAHPRCPAALRAVVSLYSTDDRYADDVHYEGGCVVGSEALSWASVMFAWNARPPHRPADWRATWLARLRGACAPWLERWLSHQTRDAFWRHGSVCEGAFGALAARCPVLMVGGWRDGYKNAVFRTVAGVTAAGGVARGLIGPWGHDWPDEAKPGPQIGFLPDVCLRWWDRYLRPEKAATTPTAADDDGDDEPALRAYIMDSLPPAPMVELWPGRWVAEQHLGGGVEDAVWLLRPSGRLARTAQDASQGFAEHFHTSELRGGAQTLSSSDQISAPCI